MPIEHEGYAQKLLSSLFDEHPEIESLDFVPDDSQSRNAAKAMTAILCNRLYKASGRQPEPEKNTTFEWEEGIFNCRNIADRDYLWSNMRRSVADAIHDRAVKKPVAYLLAFASPTDTTLNVWALPEPLLYKSLSNLPVKEGGQEYTLQISTRKQRIDHDGSSPDLTSYFRTFPLSPRELLVLGQSREIDAAVRRSRAIARGDEEPEVEEEPDSPAVESETSQLLLAAAQQLEKAGEFDPAGLTDGRERTLSSIVRRRGQSAFRQHLLTAYNGRCAITGCELEPVLEAAHIIPYKGPETNHPGNGLLLRTDLHTLFDLKLIAVDVETMTLLVSPSLAGSCYDDYRGKSINIPDALLSRPSQAALEQHRRDSGL
jgi:hypothetical protein